MPRYLAQNGVFRLTVKNLVKKLGTFYFRKVIPKDLRPLYRGKHEILKSLGKVESVALRKLQKLATHYENEFENLKTGGERRRAVELLDSFNLDPTELQYQAIHNGVKEDCKAEGSPFADLMDTLAAKHDTGGGYSPLEPYEQRAIDMLHGEEKITLMDIRDEHELEATSKKKKAEAVRSFNYFIDNMTVFTLGNIRRKQIQAIVDKLVAGGLKTATVKKPLGYVCKRVRELIIERELKIENPFQHVKVKNHRADAVKRKPFTMPLLNIVKETILNKLHLPSAQIVGLLSDTGCRNGEIGGIRLDHIVLDNDIPHLKISMQDNRRLKNTNSERIVPLVGVSLIAAKHVKNLAVDGQVYAFPRYNKDDKYNNDNCSAACNKFIKSLSSQHTSHSFRHTMRDRLVDASVPSYEIENIIGWSSGKMISHYGISKGLGRLNDALVMMMEHENK